MCRRGHHARRLKMPHSLRDESLIMNRFFNGQSRLRLLVTVIFLAFSLALVGCSESSSGPSGDREIIQPDPEGDDDGDGDDEEEEGYEAGILDGQWELSWQESGEKFSDFDIEHNLDEDRLRVAFDTVDEGDGTLGSAAWNGERFTGQWEPYPLDDGSESFTITQSEFVDEDQNRLEGSIMGVSFDFRDFVMERVLD